MITEFIQYLFTKSSKSARDLGYVYSSIALEKRARRQQKDWAQHIQKCHSMWESLFSEAQYKKVAVIGSGPLLETPMEFLIDQCEEVHLIDIVHPTKVKKRWGGNSKVKFHTADVTGAVRWLHALKKAPQNVNFNAPESPLNVDLVVSANLISQLSLEPSWYLKKKFDLQEDHPLIQDLIKKMGEQHIEHLKTYSASKIVMYTDIERIYLSPKKELLETHSSRVPDQLGNEIQGWDWSICPLGEESNEYEILMRVKAYAIESKIDE